MAIASAPSGVLDHHRPAHDGVGRDDRDLRLVDDRHRQHRAGRSVVGDRERAALDLVGAQLAGPGTIGEVADLAGERLQSLGLGVADHRRQQTLVVEVDGDAEVDVVVHDQLVVADAGVEVRELGQPVDDRPAMNGR